MAQLGNYLTDTIAPDAADSRSDAVGRWLEGRRRVCDALEALADDLCGPRSRQAASFVLDFMATGRFGAPDDHVGELIANLPTGRASHPVLAPLSEWLEEDQEPARRRERLVIEGLETIVFGRIPKNPLEFIVAALTLVEIERSYHDTIASAPTPVRTAVSPSCEPLGSAGNPQEGDQAVPPVV